VLKKSDKTAFDNEHSQVMGCVFEKAVNVLGGCSIEVGSRRESDVLGNFQP